VPRSLGVRLGTALVLLVSATVLLLSGFGSSSAATSSTAGCSTGTTSAVVQHSSATHLGPGNYEVKLTVGHRLRCLILFVPPNPSVKNRPLVLVYHGALDTASSTEEGTDFEQIATSTGEVVAFMQGYGDTWNDDAGTTPAEKAHVNDLAFTSAAILKIERLVTFDHKRIVAAGFSNGALMVQLIGCRMANTITLIVPVEGQLPVKVSRGCTPSRPVSVYEIHGTDDTAIPYNGGTFIGVGGGAITVLSAPKSAARWAKLDGCSSTPVVTMPQSGIQLLKFKSCKGFSQVRLRTIYGGVHQWGSNIGQLVASAIPAQ
jgi:polyhydroxybutyrate depolymerase